MTIVTKTYQKITNHFGKVSSSESLRPSLSSLTHSNLSKAFQEKNNHHELDKTKISSIPLSIKSGKEDSFQEEISTTTHQETEWKLEEDSILNGQKTYHFVQKPAESNEPQHPETTEIITTTAPPPQSPPPSPPPPPQSQTSSSSFEKWKLEEQEDENGNKRYKLVKQQPFGLVNTTMTADNIVQQHNITPIDIENDDDKQKDDELNNEKKITENDIKERITPNVIILSSIKWSGVMQNIRLGKNEASPSSFVFTFTERELLKDYKFKENDIFLSGQLVFVPPRHEKKIDNVLFLIGGKASFSNLDVKIEISIIDVSSWTKKETKVFHVLNTPHENHLYSYFEEVDMFFPNDNKLFLVEATLFIASTDPEKLVILENISVNVTLDISDIMKNDELDNKNVFWKPLMNEFF